MGRWITEKPLDLMRLLQETEDPGSGALVVFVGTVRDENEGRPVSGLTYEAHVPLAERVLQDLEKEIKRRFPIRKIRIQHRIGAMTVGEPSVVIVVRGAHRAEAFQACRFAIDELKKRVPIWKEETYTDGERRFLKGIPLKQEDQG